MNTETHRQLASDIWSICNLLRGPYKRNEYRKVILPLTVLRRFDCLLAPTKAQALATFNEFKAKPESIIRSKMQAATGYTFYNLSKLELAPSQKDRNSLLDDPSNLAPNLNSYINGFSPNVRAIMERFAFDQQIAKMAEKNLLFKVVQKFATLDLSFSWLPPDQAAMQMGYVFEELIRIGAEQSNEEAGEHFTPREVIKLMVNLLLSPEQDLRRSHVVKTIYDPACGTGGMLSVAEKYIRDLNLDAKPLLYGQDWNDEAWAVCRADMLIKGEDADNIAMGDTFTKDAHARDEQGQKRSFDYMLANPPFGVEWKQQRYIEHERDTLGYQGRFGAGTPRINDGALLFLQHMIDKMRTPQEGGCPAPMPSGTRHGRCFRRECLPSSKPRNRNSGPKWPPSTAAICSRCCWMHWSRSWTSKAACMCCATVSSSTASCSGWPISNRRTRCHPMCWRFTARTS